MTESKARRLVAALTVGAVLLFVFLLTIWIYQLIAINVKERKLTEIESQIKAYKVLIAEGEDTIEVRSTRQWIIREARQLGYFFDGDSIYPED